MDRLNDNKKIIGSYDTKKGRKIYFFCPFMHLYYHKIVIFSRLPIFVFVYYNHILIAEITETIQNRYSRM